MNNNQHFNRHDPQGQLVFHIRRLRQWHGDAPMQQQELAELAGVSPRRLRHYEQLTAVPGIIADLIRIAAALNVRLDELLASDVVNACRRHVVEQRNREELLRTDQPIGFQCSDDA